MCISRPGEVTFLRDRDSLDHSGIGCCMSHHHDLTVAAACAPYFNPKTESSQVPWLIPRACHAAGHTWKLLFNRFSFPPRQRNMHSKDCVLHLECFGHWYHLTSSAMLYLGQEQAGPVAAISVPFPVLDDVNEHGTACASCGCTEIAAAVSDLQQSCCV